MQEREIIELCKSGKMENFSIIYDNYIDKIFKFIYLKTYDKELSEDLTSQTFLKVIDKIHTFKNDETSNFNAWIYRIAYNLVIDNYKTKKEEINLDEILEIGYSKDFAKDIDNKDKLKEVFEFFNTLNEKHKKILIMRLWDDLSYKEISEITGESVDNCKKVVSRTLSKIPQTEILTLITILLLNI